MITNSARGQHHWISRALPIVHASGCRSRLQGGRGDGRRESRRRRSSGRGDPHFHGRRVDRHRRDSGRYVGRSGRRISGSPSDILRTRSTRVRQNHGGRCNDGETAQSSREACKSLCAHGLPPTADRIAHIGSAAAYQENYKNWTRALLRTPSSFLRRGVFTINRSTTV
jgi:hypothetical protein